MPSIFSHAYDYALLLVWLVLVLFEMVATAFTLLIPRSVLNYISVALHSILPQSPEEYNLSQNKRLLERVKRVSKATSFVELCEIHGYLATEHIVNTPDGYMLGIHRIFARTPRKRGVVYLHHGLLMNSEIWVSNASANESIAFQLAEAGYEVWLGNNRGNKYSKKHVSRHTMSRAFWNFCLDEFALYDIPSTIDYILRYTGEKSLTYIGFSQGSAQAFASLAIHPELNRKINLFIALGPAMAPPSVGPRLLHAVMTASPSLLYMLFGHRIILRSVVFWQSIMLPELFIRAIDLSNRVLFKWRGKNISWAQKHTGYSHLYSYSSVKCVVHWFQIIARNNGIHMYDDDTFSFLGSSFGIPVSKFYHVPPYPTQNIITPIEIIYGTADTLVDINALLGKIPKPVRVYGVEGYEHLEMIWGRKVKSVIVPRILSSLKKLSSTRNYEVEDTDSTLLESPGGKMQVISPPRITGPFLDTQPTTQLSEQMSEEIEFST